MSLLYQNPHRLLQKGRVKAVSTLTNTQLSCIQSNKKSVVYWYEGISKGQPKASHTHWDIETWDIGKENLKDCFLFASFIIHWFQIAPQPSKCPLLLFCTSSLVESSLESQRSLLWKLKLPFLIKRATLILLMVYNCIQLIILCPNLSNFLNKQWVCLSSQSRNWQEAKSFKLPFYCSLVFHRLPLAELHTVFLLLRSISKWQRIKWSCPLTYTLQY